MVIVDINVKNNLLDLKYINWKIFFPVIFILESCSNIYMFFYGIKNVEKEVHIKEIKKLINKNLIDEFYFLDSTYKWINYNSTKSNLFFQPLQVRIYDTWNDSLVGMISNCMVGGFPNLKWNRYNFFDSLPPPKKIMLDSVSTFKNDMAFYYSLDEKKQIGKFKIDERFIILVYFNYQMYRQSKRLIRFVRSKYKNKSNYKIFYILTDLLFYDVNFDEWNKK